MHLQSHSHSVIAVALIVLTAGCAGLTSGQPTEQPQPTESSPSQTATPAGTSSPDPSPTPARGGLLIVSSAEQAGGDHPIIEYNQTVFQEVPTLNDTITEVAATNESVSSGLSGEQLSALNQFLETEYNISKDSFRVRIDSTVVEVTIAREA